MTRPTAFGTAYPQGVGGVGGDPTLPEGQPDIDCCDTDEADQPDRASELTVFVGEPESGLFAEILADNPDWYYQLDEPSGAFLDSSGNGVTATETGTITRSVAGPIAGEDGITADTGEYLTLGYTATSLSAATIEGWYRWSGSSAVFIEQNRYGSGVGLCLQIAIGTTTFGAGDGQITAFFNTTSYWLGIHTTGTYNDDAWHHVVATWAGGGNITTGQLTIYVDGVSVATTADSGNGGGPNSAPISGQGSMSLFNRLPPGAGGAHGTVSADEMAFYPTALSAARVLAHYDATGGSTNWVGAGPNITDGDDATYQEVIGSDVIRIDLGAAFDIARIRLRIGTETAGARSYVLKGSSAADFTGAVTVTTLAFTATGSFTAQDVTDTFTAASYQYWELTGNDETRYVYSFELYEATPADASDVQAALDDHLVDTVDAHDASAVSIVDAGGYFTATQVEGALQELGAGSVAGWFNVMAYGATNDGTTDDTSAINSAIAALNTATKGVLYFPAGTGYKVTAALTAITAQCTVLGDGTTTNDDTTENGVSKILCTSTTAVVFTMGGNVSRFEKIGIYNTQASPSAGAAILVDSAVVGQRVDYENVRVRGFYDNIDIKVGALWVMHGCYILDAVRYNVRVRNTVNPDAGDWTISDCVIGSHQRATTSSLRVESSGGGKVLGCKFNSGTNKAVTGIDVVIASGNDTVILLVTNSSFENVSGDAISVATTGTGFFGHVIVSDCQFGLYSNNSGRCVKVSANTNGTFGSAGSISQVVIGNNTMHTDGTARAAVELIKADSVILEGMSLTGFNAYYTQTSSTNIIDNTEASAASFATPAIVLGSSAAVGAASTVIRSDSTIAAFDVTAPVTQAFSDVAATGSAAFAARRDHRHGMPDAPSGSGIGGLAIDSAHSNPLVFGDILQESDGSDFLYTSP
jgi:hypothetical protein